MFPIREYLLRAAALTGLSPDKCMEYSNDLLSKENISDMFVTVFYGILNTKTGEIIYSNAGHNPPCILKKDGTVVETELTHDIVLGIMEDAKFKTKNISLKPGDTIYLYTDGVTEAMNKKNELYSEKRLEKELIQYKDSSPQEIINGIISSVEEFTKGAEQSDDITMLTLKYNGN
jgi:sigma-B regulation protein RsbU (phosphoserine phosphatase)